MPRRELYTIGDVGSMGSRSRGRRRMGAMVKHPLWQMSGLGAAADSAARLETATKALVQWFAFHAPTKLKVPAVGEFQLAWNANPLSGSGITYDQQYGKNTEGAFDQALQFFATGSVAPPNAWGIAPATTPTLDPGVPANLPALPAPTPSPITPPAPIVASDDSTGWILPVAIGGAVVAGLVWFFKKKRRGGARRRPAGHMLTVRSS